MPPSAHRAVKDLEAKCGRLEIRVDQLEIEKEELEAKLAVTENDLKVCKEDLEKTEERLGSEANKSFDLENELAELKEKYGLDDTVPYDDDDVLPPATVAPVSAPPIMGGPGSAFSKLPKLH